MTKSRITWTSKFCTYIIHFLQNHREWRVKTISQIVIYNPNSVLDQTPTLLHQIRLWFCRLDFDFLFRLMTHHFSHSCNHAIHIPCDFRFTSIQEFFVMLIAFHISFFDLSISRAISDLAILSFFFIFFIFQIKDRWMIEDNQSTKRNQRWFLYSSFNYYEFLSFMTFDLTRNIILHNLFR